jgi:hypothetical protein
MQHLLGVYLPESRILRFFLGIDSSAARPSRAGVTGHVSGYPTYQESTRNRQASHTERGAHESFSLVSPYSSVSKRRGEIPPSYCLEDNPGTWAGAQLRTCPKMEDPMKRERTLQVVLVLVGLLYSFWGYLLFDNLWHSRWLNGHNDVVPVPQP